jgi:hypothetical protein
MATSWFARFYQSNAQAEVLPDTTVKVIGRQGLTLLVVPVEEDWMRSEVPISNQPEVEQSGLLGLVQRLGFSGCQPVDLKEKTIKRMTLIDTVAVQICSRVVKYFLLICSVWESFGCCRQF